MAQQMQAPPQTMTYDGAAPVTGLLIVYGLCVYGYDH